MSRTWTRWLSRWKSNLGPNRRPIRTILRTERLETRATPAVIYGMGIGSAPKPFVPPPAVVVDNPPTIHVTSQPSGAVSTNPTITGVVTDAEDSHNMSLTAKVDNQALQAVTLDSANRFSFTTAFATDGTANGVHNVTFFAHDRTGHVSPSVTVQFTLSAGGTLTLDLAAASDTGTQGNHTTTLDTVTLSGTAPAGRTVTLVQTGATATADANGAYNFANVHLNSGANTFTVRSTTAAGGPLETSRTVILDTAPTTAAPVTNFAVAQNSAATPINLPTVFSDANVNSVVRMTTNRGTFDLELFDQQVGNTVNNFLKYVTGTSTSGGSYANTIFHRLTRDATDGIDVLQGGEFVFSRDATGGHLNENTTTADAAIALQALLSNARGTIAMARTGDPNSAKSGFFFNTSDNRVLDKNGGADPNGYAVFGVVRGSGMDVVDASFATPTQNRGGAFAQIPLTGNYPPPPAGNFPTDTSIDNYEILTGVSVVRRPDANVPDSLTFQVSGNTNSALVQTSITNGELVLTYAAGQSGSATITVKATDADGAFAESQFTVSVGTDSQAPVVAVTSPNNGLTFNANPTIQGTATDNFAVSQLQAKVDDNAPQTVTVTNGQFTFTPHLPTDGTADGQHGVVFTAQDPSGNTSTPVSFTFRLDNTAPGITISSPANGQTFTTNPQIVGKVTDSSGVANVRAAVDGGAATPVTFDASGNFTFTPQATTNGSHAVVFTAQDVAGNPATPVTVTFDLQRTTAVTVTSPADGQTFTANPAITGTAADGVPDGGLQAAVDGSAAQTVPFDSTTRAFSFTPTATGDGQHVVTFTAGTDFAPVELTYRLDSTAPAVTITSPASGQTFTANPVITGTATDNQTVSSLEASVDGGPVQTVAVDAQGGYTFTPAVATDGSADGQHTATFTARDEVGNQSSPATVTFVLDTTAPAVVVSDPPSGVTLRTSPTISGTATDNIGLTSLTVSVNGGPLQAVNVDGSGNFSFNPNLPADGSADGSYQYQFVGHDAAGHSTTVNHVVYLDTTPPVATVTSPPDGQTFATNPTINVAVTDNVGSGSADVFVDGIFDREVLFDANTGFSFTPNLPTDQSANGDHTVTFIAKDTGSNHSVPVDFHFTLQS